MPQTASSYGIFWVIGSGVIARRWFHIVRESARELTVQPFVDFLPPSLLTCIRERNPTCQKKSAHAEP